MFVTYISFAAFEHSFTQLIKVHIEVSVSTECNASRFFSLISGQRSKE